MRPQVLIFDDDFHLRALYRRALQSLGEVQTFARPEEGFHRVAEADLVITDLEMPGLGGLGLLCWMRERELFVPTLLVTGAGVGDLKLQAESLADATLGKPFSVDQLRRTVGALLEPPDRVREGVSGLGSRPLRLSVTAVTPASGRERSGKSSFAGVALSLPEGPR